MLFHVIIHLHADLRQNLTQEINDFTELLKDSKILSKKRSSK
jgi:hypothetical protein